MFGKRASPIVAIITAIMFWLSVPMIVWGAEDDVPADVRQYAEEIGEHYGICPELIEAICWRETRFTPTAVNKAGTCHGIMQVYVKWHKDRMKQLGVTDIYDTYGNMLVATDYLVSILETHEDIGEALMIYSGNSSARVNRYIETGVMSSYADDVLERSYQYEKLHGK